MSFTGCLHLRDWHRAVLDTRWYGNLCSCHIRTLLPSQALLEAITACHVPSGDHRPRLDLQPKCKLQQNSFLCKQNGRAARRRGTQKNFLNNSSVPYGERYGIKYTGLNIPGSEGRQTGTTVRDATVATAVALNENSDACAHVSPCSAMHLVSREVRRPY